MDTTNNAVQLYAEIDKEKTRNIFANTMARVSRRIISLWDFAKLLGKLSDDEFICVNSTGEMYRGKVRVEKLKKMDEIYPPIKRIEYVDESLTIHELLDGTSVVQSQGKAFPNTWNSHGRLYREVVSYDADVFLELLENTPKEDIQESRVQNLHGHNYRRVTIKDFGTVGYFSVINNHLHMLEINGKEYWVN